METKSLDELKKNPKNPRTISKPDFEALKNSIAKFGDLSGIIFNTRTRQLAGGHQRIESFKAMSGDKKIIITQRYEMPNTVGTVAIGYVDYNNEQYGYREVDWSAEFEAAANIAANRISGEFDLDLLAQITYELSQLENGAELLALTGQTQDEINNLLQGVGVANEQEPVYELGERMSFNFNELQAEVLNEALGHVLATQNFSAEGNTDIRANALYFICQKYLDLLHGVALDAEQPEPAQT